MSQHKSATAAKSHVALPLISVGRVKRTYSVAERAAPASNDAQYKASATSDELNAWARRAAAANGFGDAATPSTRVAPAPDAMHLALAVRAERHAALAEIVAALMTAMNDSIRGLVARWQRIRSERETYRALHALDARTLRDLGMDASELRSVAMEVSGATDPTRAHALMRLKFLAI
jgi:uncharacterized protein YjiS (DUF1127 family)